MELPEKGLVLGHSKAGFTLSSSWWREVLGKALTMSMLEELRHSVVQKQKEEQEAARQELLRAMQGRDPAALLAALVQGELLQLEKQLLQEAQEALAARFRLFYLPFTAFYCLLTA